MGFAQIEPRAGRSEPFERPAEASAPRWRMSIRIIATLLALSATLVVVALIGYWRMFSRFSFYDDEGCVLITIKSFMDGHPLYDDVFSMYGPFPILLKWLIFAAVGVPVGHDAGRLIALGYWLTAAVFSGAAAWRLTRSIVAGWAAGLFVFHGLGQLTHEPGHPQDLCAVLLALAVLLATYIGTTSGRQRTAILVAIGIVAGCLAMTKINVFVFMMMALGAAVLTFTARTRPVAALVFAYAVGMLIVPAVLMRDLLDRPSYWSYALGVTLALVPIVILGIGRPVRPIFALRHGAWISAGLLGSIGAIAAVVLACGTTVGALIDGVLVIPLRAGVRFINATGAFNDLWTVPAAFIAWALAWLALERAGRASRAVPSLFSAALRIGYGASLLYWNRLMHPVPYASLLGFGVPAAVLVLIPRNAATRPAGEAFGRLFLAFLAVTEALWGYPVMGSQQAFSTFLAVLLLVVVVADGCRDLAAVCGQWAPWPTWIAGRLGQAAIVGALVLAIQSEFHVDRAIYHRLRPLDLPGAHAIHVEPPMAESFQRLAKDLRALPDSFFTLPGMYSFYFWAERDSPTTLTLTNWMYMLDDRQQERIVAELQARPDIRVVYSPNLLKFWMRSIPLRPTPLIRYINANFAPATTIHGTEIWVRRTAPAAPGSPPRLPIKPF